MAKQRLVISSLVLALMGVSATAQVAPPPGKKPDGVRDYTPPPRPQAAPPTPRPQPARPQPRVRELPDLPFDQLVQMDDEGKLIRLKEPPTVAAIRVNPMIDGELQPAIADVLDQRKATFRELVVEHIDDAVAVNDGLVETLRVEQKDDMTDILQAVQRLSTRTAEQELSDLGVITEDAAAFNRRIATTYLNALSNELLENVDEEAVMRGEAPSPADVQIQMMLNQHLEEAMNAFNEIAGRMPGFINEGGLSSLGLSGEQTAAINELKPGLTSGDTKSSRQAAGRIIQQLDDSQRQQMLEAMFRR